MVQSNPVDSTACCFCSFNDERSIPAIQIALATVACVGGLTATFALVGYLPSYAAWVSLGIGGTSFVGFCIVTAKYYCTQEEYLFALVKEGASNESSELLEKEPVQEDALELALRTGKEPKLWLSNELKDPNPLLFTGKYLLFLSEDKHIVWDFAKGMESSLEEATYVPIKSQPEQLLQIQDNALKVIDLGESRPIKTESLERDESVFQRVFHDSDFVYALWLSSDKKTHIIKRWDPELENSVEIRIPCTDASIEIIDIKSFDDKIVFAYADRAAEIWNLETNKKISKSSHPIGKTLENYLIAENFEFSIPNNRAVKFRELNSASADINFQSEDYRYVLMQPHDGTVRFAVVDDKNNGKVLTFLTSRENWFEWDLKEKVHEKSFCIHEGKLIIGSCDGRVRISDLESGERQYDDSIFDSKVSVIGASGSKIALSWNDRVAVLDFSQS